MFSPDQAAYLAAIEERLTKLEGSVVKVEFEKPLASGKEIMSLAYEYGEEVEIAVDGKATGNPKIDIPASAIQALGQSKKICPVSGMFLEEPEDGQQVIIVHSDGCVEITEYNPGVQFHEVLS